MLTPTEVAERGFERLRIGGYNPAEVDTFLDAVTADYTALYKDCATLKGKMKALVEKVEEYRSTEDDMRSMLGAFRQKGEEIVSRAQEKANGLIAAAEVECTHRVDAANDQITLIEQKGAETIAAIESDRVKRIEAAEEMIAEAERQAKERIEEIENDRVSRIEAAEAEVADYRAQLQQELRDYEQKLSAARSSTVNFVTAMRTIVQAQASFLDRIPNISETNPDGAQTDNAPEEAPAPVEMDAPAETEEREMSFAAAESGTEYQV